MAPSRAAVGVLRRCFIAQPAARPPLQVSAVRSIQADIAGARNVWSRHRCLPFQRLYSGSAATFNNEALGKQETNAEAPEHLSEGERAIYLKVMKALKPTSLEVQDVSGGCGSMYAIDVTSSKFNGLPMIKQHRLVNDVLNQDIKAMHGLQLRTRAS